MFDFERFFAVPETFEAEGFRAAEAGVKSVFLAGADYNGEPTRIFAWYGVPEGASKELGFLMYDAWQTSRADVIIACIVLFAILGKVSDGLLALGERICSVIRKRGEKQ